LFSFPVHGRHKDIFGSPVRPYSGQFQFRVQDQSELNGATASLGELLPAAELRLSKLIYPHPLLNCLSETEDEASLNAQGNLNGCLIKTGCREKRLSESSDINQFHGICCDFFAVRLIPRKSCVLRRAVIRLFWSTVSLSQKNRTAEF